MDIFHLLHGLLVLFALLLLIPVLFFALQCWLGLMAKKAELPLAGKWQSLLPADILVLIPAHNETLVIGNTLHSILPQLAATDRLLVIADNCQDDTGAVVALMRQEVIVRNNAQQIGKGFALAYGLDAIRHVPPAILLIIDADCQILPDFIEQMRQQVMRTGLPAQADNLMYAPNEAPISVKISAFAVLVKNRIRMRGMNQLAGHVPLLGTGMAFPWAMIEAMPLANAEIAEDIYLGLQLVVKQQGAKFAGSAGLISLLPIDASIQKGQRERWEQGHIDLIKRMLPSLLKQAFQQRSWPILATALDLSIPPLSLLILLNLSLMLIALFLWLQSGVAVALMLSSINLTIMLITVLACWLIAGRGILRFKDLLQIPAYVWHKIAIYRDYLVAKQTKWVKTKR